METDWCDNSFFDRSNDRIEMRCSRIRVLQSMLTAESVSEQFMMDML